MNLHGFDIPDYGIYEFSDDPLEKPITLNLKHPEYPEFEILLIISSEGMKLEAKESETGEIVSEEKLIQWPEIKRLPVVENNP